MRFCPRFFLICALAAALLPGCSLFRKSPRKAHAPAVPEKVPKHTLLVGTIVLVNPDGAFVLIDNGSRPSPSVNALAESRSADGTSAELRVTEVRKRPFIVADLISGTPHQGDEVFQ